MINAIATRHSILKVVGNNHNSSVPQLPVHRLLPGLPQPPLKLKAGEFIAGKAFNIFGCEDAISDVQINSCGQLKYKHYIPACACLDAQDIAVTEQSIKKLTKVAGLHPEIKAAHIVRDFNSDHPSELLHGVVNNIITFSKLYQQEEFVIAYNTSTTEPVETCIRIQGNNGALKYLSVLFGYDDCGNIPVNKVVLQAKTVYYVKLYLKPLHLIILKNF